MSDIEHVARLAAEVGNFRSLAGIVGAGGRRVREGVLYRAGTFVGLSESGREALAALGVRALCDLRSPRERARQDFTWPGAVPRSVEVDLLPDARVVGPEMLHRIMEDTTGEYLRTTQRTLTGEMPDAFSDSMRQVFDTLLSDDGVPLLVQCVLGKDRTGYVVAVILLALGVSRADVIAEFMRSVEGTNVPWMREEILSYLDTPPDPVISVEALRAVVALPEYLEAAFASIEARHDNVDRFLADACGLDADRRARLQERLLEL